MDKYAIAIIITIFNLVILRALLPIKKRLDEKRISRRTE